MNNNDNLNQNSIPNIESNTINNTPNVPQAPVGQSIPTQVTLQPVAQAPVQMQQPIADIQPTTISQPQPNVVSETISNNTNIEEVSTPSNVEDISDVADITFDYNQIYGVQNDNENKEDSIDVVDKPMFTAQEVTIKVNDLQGRATNDVVPEFNINALNNNVSKEDAKLSDNVLSDRQQEKQETRRAIIWIVVLVLILVIFVGFIFPIINGYKF